MAIAKEMIIFETETKMNKKLYTSNWLSNASVAALIVGGFL